MMFGRHCLRHTFYDFRVSYALLDATFVLSITGLEITFIRRAISFFSEMEIVDAEKIGIPVGVFLYSELSSESRSLSALG